MKENDHLERQIRNLLAVESDSLALSEKLFSPQGLFNRLAGTAAERRAVAESALFKEAQKRLSELKRTEADAFSKAVATSEHGSGGPMRMLKIERV